jgi:hypothetical protein
MLRQVRRFHGPTKSGCKTEIRMFNASGRNALAKLYAVCIGGTEMILFNASFLVKTYKYTVIKIEIAKYVPKLRLALLLHGETLSLTKSVGGSKKIW